MSAIDFATTDVVVLASRDISRGAASGLRYTSDSDEIAREIDRLGGVSNYRGGGCASNALYAFALAIADDQRTHWRLTWQGATGQRRLPTLLNPLDDLRRVGVLPVVLARSQDCEAAAVCAVDRQDGTHRGTLVLRTGTLDIAALRQSDVMITALSALARAKWDDATALPAESVALLVDTSMEASDFAELRSLRLPNLRFLFGTRRELDGLGVLERLASDSYAGVEVVVSDGAGPGEVWLGRLNLASWLPDSQPELASEIGAGDAFAGTYLALRLAGTRPQEAAARAAEAAGRTLRDLGARAAPPDDLNALFGKRIDRASESTSEGRLFDRVREVPEFGVISGGQTGVDTIGLEVATALGLPAFGIFPQGRRSDDTDSGAMPKRAVGDACLLELATPSYRYRTWANVYYADGTILYDFRGTEGSAETRRAADALGRPCLELSTQAADDVVATAKRWADEHDIRVVNIAGNRAASLSAAELAAVEQQLRGLLPVLARSARERGGGLKLAPKVRAARRRKNRQWSQQRIRFGIPASAAGDAAMAQLFGNEAMSRDDPLCLAWESGPMLIGRFRARSLPTLLRESKIDAALCSAEILVEAGSMVHVVADTHIGLTMVVTVAAGVEGCCECVSAPDVVSQYPRLAKRFAATNRDTVAPIDGAAEAYLRLGLARSAVDTWRTGRTAYANGLTLTRVHGTSSLLLVTADSEVAERLTVAVGA